MGGEKDPQEATLGHPETTTPPPSHPALLKGGREKKGKPRVAGFPKKSSQEDRTSEQGKKEPEGLKVKGH